MAVLSRPSLRSSTRRNDVVDEVPPTETQNALPEPRRAKRTRDNSIGGQSQVSIKKLRINPPKRSDHPKEAAKSRPLKSLPLRDKSGKGDAVTSRFEDSPPQKANGSAIATLERNVQHLNKNHKLTINTATGQEQTGKRNLRSHVGGTRGKSELALYFSNYDELVSITHKEPDFLTPDTLLHIIDEPLKPKNTLGPSSSNSVNGINNISPSSSISFFEINSSSSDRIFSESTFTDLTNATRVDLSSLDKSIRHQKDPLHDAIYHKAHRRAERQEKQLRNIEKERAMHEKVQLERLMDGLRGHDWLRVMGISGITDGEKKAYEPKRDYFKHEVRVLLKKFQEWKEEEKRRKVEKDDSMQDEDEEQDDDESDMDEDSDGDPPDYNGVDPSARQLHQEAVLATIPATAQVRSHYKKQVVGQAAEKPFTSFYAKPYLREAAIGKHRRGRTRSAFGQPLPEPLDRDFELGNDILTSDVLAAQERKRRVVMRRIE